MVALLLERVVMANGNDGAYFFLHGRRGRVGKGIEQEKKVEQKNGQCGCFTSR